MNNNMILKVTPIYIEKEQEKWWCITMVFYFINNSILMRLMLLPTHVHVRYFFAVAFVTVIIVLVAIFVVVVASAVIATFF